MLTYNLPTKTVEELFALTGGLLERTDAALIVGTSVAGEPVDLLVEPTHLCAHRLKLRDQFSYRRIWWSETSKLAAHHVEERTRACALNRDQRLSPTVAVTIVQTDAGQFVERGQFVRYKGGTHLLSRERGP